MQGVRDISRSLISAVREGRLERAKQLISSFGLSYSRRWSDGYVLLCDALKNNHTEIAKLLLTHGSKIKCKTKKRSDTPLHLAVRNCAIEIIEMLLDRGANIDAECEKGTTPLHDAIRWEKMEIVELLLNRGADVNAKGKSGKTYLHIAADEGYVLIAEHLLKHGADVNSVWTCDGNKHYSPLYLAVINGHEKVVKLLLECGANVDARDLDGKTILYYAVKVGRSLIIEHLLKHSPDIDNISNRSVLNVAVLGYGKEYRKIIENLLEYGFTINFVYGNNCELLHEAVKKECLKIVEEIIKYGVSIDFKDTWGRTALHIASEWTNPEIVKVLLHFGADINSKDRYGGTALHIASEWGNPEIVKVLIKFGAKIDSKDKDGSTALHIASGKGEREIVEVLLKYGAEIDSQDEHGKTALHIASEDSNTEIVDVLLNYGASINFKDIRGRTALHSATVWNNPEIIKVLLKFGAYIDSKNIYGGTALHVACMNFDSVMEVLLARDGEFDSQVEYNNTEIVKIFLEFGANIHSKTTDGLTALHIASQKRNREVIEVLLKFGARVNSKDGIGRTALHIASDYNNSEIVGVLLEFGADIDSEDIYGRTALHIACTEMHKKVAIVLLDHGSDVTILSESNYPRSFAEIFKRHAVKVKTANLYVKNRNLLISSDDEELSDFRNECEREVATMKSEKIGNISLYDILTKGISELAIYAGNESIVQVFESDNYEIKFPIYATLINSNFRKGKRRKDLMEQGIKIFHSLFTNYLSIPHDCTEKVFNYLSDEDLRSIMDACKPMSNSNPNTDM